VLFVFASTRLVTMVRSTPGGVGVIEAMLIGSLVAAAVLVFRALTWLLPVPLGGLTYLAWRRQQARRRSSAPDVSPVADA
jgi:putative heme transporter